MGRRLTRIWLIAALLVIPATALAQAPAAPAAPPGAAEQLLKPEQLDALVAPIALYPDPLLSLVLMASTYPLEIVQAERWLAANKLKGDQLKAAVDKQAWDDSIKSLAATPEVVSMMSSKLDWTQKLGDAVLAQQGDVMDAVQRLRAKAQANDKLKSTKEQKVVVKREQDKQVIVIEQTDPNTVYVPYYDPAVVYGAWPYAAYPPYYFPTPGYIAGGLIATGLAFGAGYALGRWATGGNWWGGGCNWGGNNLVVNRPVNINNVGNNWQHRPEHRHGVRYSNSNVQQKFGNNDLRARSGERSEFRGHEDRQADRGDRQGDRQADRADRQGDRQSDRGDRQGDRQADRGDRQGDRQANRGDRQGDRAASKGDRVASKGSQAGPKRDGGAAKGANRPNAGRPTAGTRPAGGGAFNVQSGSMANLQSARGQASLGGARGGGAGLSAGGGPRGGGFAGGGGFSGGGGFRGGGGGGGFRGGGGGGRRSDVRLKHDIVLLRHLDSGIGLYRFRYGGDEQTYVGVLAQEAAKVMPQAVARGRDGYLRVFYDRLGVKFETYEQWINANGPTAIH